MTEATFKTRWAVIVLAIFLVTLSRLAPHALGVTHLFNFSPLGGVALFGAAYASRKELAFVLPLLALWISNLLIDNIFYSNYYQSFAWFANWEVYLAISIIVCTGMLVLQKVSAPRVLGASLMASVLFFLVTNFMVWLNYDMYPKTGMGLLGCYTAAIPFFGNTLVGDLLFSGLLFGGFEWLKKHNPELVLEPTR